MKDADGGSAQKPPTLAMNSEHEPLAMTQEEKIDALIDRLEKQEEPLEQILFDKADLVHAHKQKRAKEFLAAEGTVKEREMIADQNASDEMLKRFRAEAEAQLALIRVENTRAALTGRQSILRSERERKV